MAKNKLYNLTFLFVFCFFYLGAQQITLSGYVQDASTHEQLVGCNIIDTLTKKGTITNNFGFFSFSTKKTKTTFCFSYIGYKTYCQSFVLKKDTSIVVKLFPDVELQTIEVISDRYAPKVEQIGVHYLQVKDIKLLPTISGEVDVMKSMQLLPGVQSGSEGQTGLYVRGGTPDQNLILIDDIPIYYSSHALGFLSTFNADAIKNVSLTKGAFPARFGGRLSSVMEIRMKEGNLKEIHGEGSVGLLASKITVEGPIQKEKTSFIFSARRTYLDILAKPIIKNIVQPISGVKVKPRIYFYDLNGTIQHIINGKNRLYLSSYFGSDVFGFRYIDQNDEYTGGINWRNSIVSLKWSSEWSNKLFSNITFYYTKYQINISTKFNYVRDEEKRIFDSRYSSGIKDWGGKVDFDFIPNNTHYIKFGSAIVAHEYRPGAINIQSNIADITADTIIGSALINNIEGDFYVEDEINFRKLKTNVGAHGSFFKTDKKQYISIQPRVSLSYELKNNLILKGSYSMMNQYINLLTSDILNLPSDIWVPSTKNILPQISHQFALGFSKPIKEEWKLSLEGYYKKMKNVVAYKEGNSFETGLVGDWEDKITQGEGLAYGSEIFLQKTKGKTTGWLGYTLAWNWRQFDDLNLGRKFPHRYDRRHDISLVISHRFNKKIKASAIWIYSTGNAVSIPTYRYAVNYSYST
ncbi:MAG TPA: TonB-dependent receptor, partial [Bacteroidetes bacterium]|nr:TonB-dependent receptor [Bacteroidota bacterium]